MTNHSAQLQAILGAAVTTATAQPTAANIAAVEKARKALDEYSSAQDDTAGKFKTQAAALEYLQRNWRIEKSKLSKDVQGGKVPRKDGFFTACDLDYYAAAVHLEAKTSELAEPKPAEDEIKRETARKLRLANEEKEGLLISKAEEEARDARLWSAIKLDIENHASAIVNELINRVIPLIPDEDIKQHILNMAHELRLTYEDAVCDIFDRYAKDGGIEA